MTVCIAAIGTWTPPPPSPPEPVVILAADRMITVKDVREYELWDQTKTFELTTHIRVLMSGSVEPLLEICRDVRSRMEAGGITGVQAAAKMIASEFSAIRAQRNERRVLAPYGLTFDTFHSRQKQFSTDFIEQIHTDLADWRHADLGGTALVAGVDDSGGHIYLIDDPGQEECCDAAGFAAIGIGTDHAEAEFMAARYTQNWMWTHGLVLSYAAKKRAEVAPGVGWATDLYYITKAAGTIYFEPNSPLQVFLAGVYRDRQIAELDALFADHKKLLDWMADNATKEAAAAPKETAQAAVKAIQSGATPTDAEGVPDGPKESEPQD
ncbi:MAG TPA: hypothetical protein VEZ14_00015 [Dehalococcoidia bacterium]|nr:hypothetical protein [Dehalococcoidia bacterium]